MRYADDIGIVVGELNYEYLYLPMESGEFMADEEKTPVDYSKEQILQFFDYSHLKPELRDVSRPFCDLAYHVVGTLPRNAERTVALRKILEAKDAAVRAYLSVPVS